MNQREYTFSNKDKKFLSALMFLHLSFVLMIVSFFGLYYHSETKECRRVAEKLELAEWATNEVNKSKAEHQLESIKENYNHQGISAEEF